MLVLLLIILPLILVLELEILLLLLVLLLMEFKLLFFGTIRQARGLEGAAADPNAWEVRMAAKYYKLLFKEYALADLSRSVVFFIFLTF